MVVLLNENVFISFGYKKSLIYDLRDKFVNLFWLNKTQTIEVKKIVNNPQYSSTFIENLKTNNLLDTQKIKKISLDLKNKIDFTLFNFAWIEVTNKCNFTCIHCYGKFCPSNFNELSLSDIQLIIDNLQKLKIKNIQLIGGEPLILQEKLKKIINKLTDYKFNIEIFTNGYYINEKWCDFFKEKNIRLALSIYSHNEEIHNKITNNLSSFKKLKLSIKLLNKFNIPYRIAYVKTKYNNTSTTEDIRNTFKIPNTHYIKNDSIRLVGNSNFSLLDSKLANEKLLSLNYFKQIKLESDLVKRNLFRHNCFSYKFYIDSTLNVFPCVMERRKKYGNLKFESLINILEKNKNTINLTKDSINTCKICEFRYVCFDCRPDNGNSNFNEKPWYCTYNPKKGEWNENTFTSVK